MFETRAEDYGVVADNVTDCTDALAKALDAGGVTVLPAGFIRTRYLDPPAGARIVGAGSGGYGLHIDPRRTTTLRLMPHQQTDALIHGRPGAAHVTLEHLNLDGGQAGGCVSSGIILDAISPAEEGQWRLRDVYVHEFTGDGIVINAGRRGLDMGQHSIVLRNGGHGVVLRASDCHVTDTIIGGNTGDGIVIAAAITRVLACDIYGNGNGITVAPGGIGQVIIGGGTGIDRNRQHGINLGWGAWNIIIDGVLMHSNSQEADGQWHHINAPSVTNLTVSGSFGLDEGMTCLPGYALNLGTDTHARDTGILYRTGSTRLGVTNAPQQLTAA